MSRPFTASERAKDARLRREYGITLREYRSVLKAQGNACAICRRKEMKLGKAFKNGFAVDHDHITGLVRGLLCWSCNKALGVFRDNLERLKASAAYLMNPPVTLALGREVYTAPGRVGTKRRAKLLAKLKKGSNGQP